MPAFCTHGASCPAHPNNHGVHGIRGATDAIGRADTVSANLASLNELITELVRAAADHGWTEPEFADMVRDNLQNHSHALGFSFQGIPPDGDDTATADFFLLWTNTDGIRQWAGPVTNYGLALAHLETLPGEARNPIISMVRW